MRDLRKERLLLDKDALPWLILAALAVVLGILMASAYWRSSSTGPQIQVPMFYDAHYLYPRPWTQEQSAPGIPEPAPVALYGENTIEQSFKSGAGELAKISFWLAGPAESIVMATVTDNHGNSWQKEISLEAGLSGKEYAITFPPQPDSRGRWFKLSLYSPAATPEHPLIVRSVGGDRLGETMIVNDFSRPGNLALTTYSRGGPGLWWFYALTEQLLPDVFRLRIQQYKMEAFKGTLFSWLLLITASLSAVLLFVASPGQMSSGHKIGRSLLRSLGWFLVIVIGSFLVWQLGSERVQIAANANETVAEPLSDASAKTVMGEPWLFADLINDLWTAERDPESRYVNTEIAAGYPAIRVPGDSEIRYAVTIPPDSRLRIANAAVGEGEIEFDIMVNDQLLGVAALTAVTALPGEEISWTEYDLDPWSGQGVVLSLNTERLSGEAQGLWLMPQILTDASWLLTEIPRDKNLLPQPIRFEDTAELLAVTVDDSESSAPNELSVQLSWRPLQTTDRFGKVFVHLIDTNGQLLAQHDAAPVDGIFPFPSWRPGSIIQDEHILRIEGDLPPGPYRLGIGIYDPDSLARWQAVRSDGAIIEEDRVILDFLVGDQP